MPTTTNYGWTTPADTDLVKDGAAAIRTLGSAIDTTVFNNANAAIAKSIVDAKGDLIAATAADTVARLAVGTNGQFLKANSATSSGLEWADVSAGGLTSIASGSLTGASVSLSSISSQYVHLWLVLKNVYMASNSGLIRVTLNNDTGTSYTSRSGYLAGFTVAAEDTYLTISDTLSSTNTKNTINFQIFNYTDSDAYRHLARFSTRETSVAGQVAAESYGMAWYNKTSAVNRIDLLAYLNNGNTSTFSGGTYTLYGVK